MQEPQEIHQWESRPNRDQALDRIYAFLRALHNADYTEAARQVYVKDMDFFRQKLHEALHEYLSMIIEDEDWGRFEKADLAGEVEDPDLIDEDLSLPEFTGRNFEMLPEESVSLKVGMRGQVTPIRLHFALTAVRTGYLLRLHRITAS